MNDSLECMIVLSLYWAMEDIIDILELERVNGKTHISKREPHLFLVDHPAYSPVPPVHPVTVMLVTTN